MGSHVASSLTTPQRSIFDWLANFIHFRMATDLNLHRRTATTNSDTAEGRAREKEIRNRERTWILCFCLDRSFSAQMGKPYTIKEE